MQDFLARQERTYLAEKLRGDWLRLLGKQQRWREFDVEYPKISQADQDLACYGLQSRLARQDPKALDDALPLWRSLLEVPEPCGPVLDALVAGRKIGTDDVWARIRRQFEVNKTGSAWNTAQYLPLGQTPERKLFDQLVSYHKGEGDEGPSLKPALREVIEKKMFSNTEDLLPVISFNPKASKGDQQKHQDFVKRMTERGYTEKQVRLLSEWYLRVRKAQ